MQLDRRFRLIKAEDMSREERWASIWGDTERQRERGAERERERERERKRVMASSAL
jgi:hypothetical protein